MAKSSSIVKFKEKSMTTIFTVNGASRAGKDEVTKLLKEQYGYRHIHPLSNLYCFLEEHFELPKGSLMSGESKQFVAPGGEITMAEALVKFYHFMLDNKVGNWTEPHVRRALDWNLEKQQSLVFSGLRNHHESDLIRQAVDKYRDYTGYDIKLVSIWITRPGFSGYSSDDKQWEIYNRLAEVADMRAILENDSSLAAFLSKINNFIKEYKLDERRTNAPES